MTATERNEPVGTQRMYADLRRWSLANLRYLADLILPPVCVHCHALVADHRVLCADCWRGMEFITPPLCERLGTPLGYSQEKRPVSAAALRDPPVFARARAAARFSGVMRNLVHAFKYADRHEAADVLARLMHVAGGELLADAELLVPVPLHPLKLWQRRYNQAAILAAKISALTGRPADFSALQRARRTGSQVGLSSAERQENVTAAFVVPEAAARRLKGKRVLLIDDVMTTGATLSACAQTLKHAGAAQIDCLAAAMTVGSETDC